MNLSRAMCVPLLAGAVAACAGKSSAPPRARIVPAAPVPAVAAAPAWTAGDVRALRARLESALRDPVLQTSGITVVDGGGRPLFARNERRALTPASTFKLLCAVTALATLGPGFRFETDLRALDDPADGTVTGDVWLVGSGDPTLTSEDLRAGAAAVARTGVRRVTGALVADASAFGGAEINAGWDRDDLQYGFAAGSSALALDGGTIEFHLVPAVPGAPARILLRPAGDAVRVTGGVMTSYATSLSIERAADRNEFAFQGRIAAGAEQSFWRPVVNMPLYAGRVFRSFLAERGVAVRDGVRAGVAPLGGRVLWLHRSPPLAEIVRRMLFTSDNHYAEQLLRAVGAQRGVGTTTSGAAVERAVLARAGVPLPGLRIVDGSGLAAGDRIAPVALAALLARAAAQPTGTTLIAALPRVGLDGTVKWRHVTAALGRARAKSGHIANVNALAGYVQTRRHGRVAFAFIVNDVRADDGTVDAGIDRALDLLAQE